MEDENDNGADIVIYVPVRIVSVDIVSVEGLGNVALLNVETVYADKAYLN